MRESGLRVRSLQRPPRRLLPRLLHWGAWLNYLLSMMALVAGIAAGSRFAEIGFDLMLNNVSGEQVQMKVIRKIPAWIFIYKGVKLW